MPIQSQCTLILYDRLFSMPWILLDTLNHNSKDKHKSKFGYYAPDDWADESYGYPPSYAE